MLALAVFASVTILSVYDGDTYSANIANVPPIFGENIRIRVRGIDAPDLISKSQCEAKKAIESRDFVRRFFHGKKITLKNVWRDKYFRLLADVEADGISVAGELLKRKLAVPYYGTTKPKVDWCKF